jgi:hypothetical protein
MITALVVGKSAARHMVITMSKVNVQTLVVHWSFPANPYKLDYKDWDWELKPEGFYWSQKGSNLTHFRPWYKISEIEFQGFSNVSPKRAETIARKTVV